MKRYLLRAKYGYPKLFAVLLVVVLAGLGLVHLTYAATGSLTFNPGSGSYTVGSTFTVTVVENSGTNAAVSVEADVSYPANLLQFVGDTTVAPFSTNPSGTDTASGGLVKVTRAQLGSSSTGAQTVTVMTFTVLAAGSAQLNFGNGSAIGPLTPGPSLLTSSPSVTYSLSVPPPAAPVISSFVATPSTVTAGQTSLLTWQSANVVSGGCSIGSTSLTAGDPAGSWPTPALSSSASYTLSCKNSANVSVSQAVTVTVNQPTSGSGSGGSSSSKTTSIKVNTVTVPNNGNVAISNPVNVQPATIQTEGVKKVEYYLNGKLVDTETQPPFTYKVDTSKLGSGTYTLLSKTYYDNGSVKQTTQHLNVQNAAKKVSATSIGLTLLIIAAIIAGIILIQRRRGQFQTAGYAPVTGPTVPVNTDPIVTPPSPALVTPQAPGTVAPAPRNITVTGPAPGTVIEHDKNLES